LIGQAIILLRGEIAIENIPEEVGASLLVFEIHEDPYRIFF
jgi:hypothetical protein